jgi:plastocyanin
VRRFAAALLVVLACSGAAAAVARAPVAVGVSEREYRIESYRSSVARGPVRFNISNYGEDTHNLVVRGPHGFHATGPDLRSGARAAFSVTLRRTGTYTLLCTRAGHARLGMRTRLVVR